MSDLRLLTCVNVPSSHAPGKDTKESSGTFILDAAAHAGMLWARSPTFRCLLDHGAAINPPPMHSGLDHEIDKRRAIITIPTSAGQSGPGIAAALAYMYTGSVVLQPASSGAGASGNLSQATWAIKPSSAVVHSDSTRMDSFYCLDFARMTLQARIAKQAKDLIMKEGSKEADAMCALSRELIDSSTGDAHVEFCAAFRAGTGLKCTPFPNVAVSSGAEAGFPTSMPCIEELNISFEKLYAPDHGPGGMDEQESRDWRAAQISPADRLHAKSESAPAGQDGVLSPDSRGSSSATRPLGLGSKAKAPIGSPSSSLDQECKRPRISKSVTAATPGTLNHPQGRSTLSTVSGSCVEVHNEVAIRMPGFASLHEAYCAASFLSLEEMARQCDKIASSWLSLDTASHLYAISLVHSRERLALACVRYLATSSPALWPRVASNCSSMTDGTMDSALSLEFATKKLVQSAAEVRSIFS